MDERYDVIQEISPKDDMFQAKIGLPPYLRAGKTAIDSIKNAMKLANKNNSEIKNILDFASGYGRVLRHLKASFPNSSITACDIQKDAVDFCQKTFEANPVYSQKDFEKIPITQKFDLIWVGSLLTHLNKNEWEQILNMFSLWLENRGLLVFTVNGRFVVNRLTRKIAKYGLNEEKRSSLIKQYETTGFGYVDYPGQSNYGFSVSSPSFVLSILEKKPELKIVMYLVRGLNKHQDVIACLKQDKKFALYRFWCWLWCRFTRLFKLWP